MANVVFHRRGPITVQLAAAPVIGRNSVEGLLLMPTAPVKNKRVVVVWSFDLYTGHPEWGLGQGRLWLAGRDLGGVVPGAGHPAAAVSYATGCERQLMSPSLLNETCAGGQSRSVINASGDFLFASGKEGVQFSVHARPAPRFEMMTVNFSVERITAGGACLQIWTPIDRRPRSPLRWACL